MQGFLDILVGFANWFWGIPILILIGGGGAYISLRLGFIQIRKFPYLCSQTFGKMFAKTGEGEVSPFSAACAALASSIGASNIVGVPVAIAMGGPGSIFWMWVLAILGCATKYAEIALGIKYREKNEDGEWAGGPFYYLRALGGPVGKFLGAFYAFGLMIELIPSLATQGLSATSQFAVFGVSQTVVGIIIAAIVTIVCIGGITRIAKVMDLMVPIMAVVYLLGALVIIGANIGNLIPSLASIFIYAFTPHAAIGGFAGSTIALALRWGAARGVYSNEAGFGTAPAAHCTASVDHPIRQAAWGVFEVVVDTLIVCTVTALCVLTSGVWINGTYESGALGQAAFNSVFGSAGDYFVAICVFMFVMSTIIVCVFYGQRQAEFLFGVKFGKAWRFVYIIFMVIATLGFDLTFMYQLTDFFLAIIIIPNMIGVIMMAGQVKELQDEYYNTPGKFYLADVAAKQAKK